ncbi:hypothetical protein [Comamonas endophytica]|uniref:Flp pilus assembly protein TadD n=1 Tax=Comamonas endophytica TaxID=2949090 RepID=A0ABY6GA42_9BURK|nr:MULTISPECIES: hypothetical protein [unclassified Acidovorax]MCD2512154.1 hypothetical protein [Acidovorax sp. D4N7]UYG51927.1 hypothetical protein M9799_01350 [Acidovorax sp. 5MLIR]
MFAEARHPRPWRSSSALALAAAAWLLAGCAAKPPQGYGAAPEPGTAQQAQQQLEQAERLTQIDPQQTYLNLIAQMQRANQWYASLAHADAFERQYGSNAQIRLRRADALRNTGQAQPAETAYRALLGEADPQVQARAHRGLGLLFASQQRYAPAVEQLEHARRLDPIDADLLADLAYTHMLDGRLDAAALPMLQAAQLAPANARVQLNLALYWLASGAREQAAQLLQRLRQPPAANASPLIDDTSLQALQVRLAAVEQAVNARQQALVTSQHQPRSTLP